jgi:site-specific recombinase XerD
MRNVHPRIDCSSQKIINDFFCDRNLRKGTEKRYLSVYRSFLSFFNSPLLQASDKNLYDYYIYLETAKYSQSTIEIHAAALNQLFSWLHEKKYISKDNQVDIKIMRGNFCLKESLFHKLKQNIESRKLSPRVLRDSILLNLLYLGLNITTISQLSCSSYQSPYLLVDNRKIFLDEQMQKIFQAYLSLPRKKFSNSLLVAHHKNPNIDGQPLSFFSTYKSFENIFAIAGIKFCRLRDCI